MNHDFSVKVYVLGETTEQPQVQKSLYTAVDHAQRFLKNINAKDPNSELAQINKINAKGTFPVSHELGRAIETGLAVSKKTNGVFDITRPSNQSYYKKIKIKEGALSLKAAGIVIDLDDLSAGLLADLIADDLVNAGWNDCLVKVGDAYVSRGSDLYNPWKIPVVVPGNTQAKRVLYYKAKGGASGATWKGSVTAFAPSGAESIGIAAALHLMGIEGAKNFLAGNKNLRALFIDDHGNVTHIPKY